MFLFKNKSVINATYNSAVILSTSGCRARNTTLSKLVCLWSGIVIAVVTIAATRSTSAH